MILLKGPYIEPVPSTYDTVTSISTQSYFYTAMCTSLLPVWSHPALTTLLETILILSVRDCCGYSYKASITHGNPMLLVSVYLEASRFKIDKICKEVLEPLSAPMNMEALTHLASSSEAAGCEQILKECARVLCDCAFALFSGMKHMQLGPQAMALILEHDNLQLDEMQVYLSAAAWLHQYIENFGELSDPSIIIEDAQSIYKAIRFCSMSPQRLQDVREPELDSIILNACLRKFSGNEWKPRVFPWTENCEYEVQWRGSLYPTAITRANNQRAGRQWAWTIGSPRLVSEVLYATEIVRTEKGAIHVGVATDDHGNKGKLACYFDHEAKAFVTASIGTDPLTSMKASFVLPHKVPVVSQPGDYATQVFWCIFSRKPNGRAPRSFLTVHGCSIFLTWLFCGFARFLFAVLSVPNS
ncbi:uncharacterized protein LOC34618842 [Cyclospora cayetanensis]|uniref:Uncharacterized protein LOC34618842 n=1 Tax=Cyclospora cayetanensis TaxID=88456 RepID=A0A6P6S2D5_9EIME|nr:uncharacterized protein LOC34618842 [Cyclospora cayetanensis]